MLVIGIFVALPFFLYFQFRDADHKLQDLVTRGIQQRNWLIAEALTPALQRSRGAPDRALLAQLGEYGQDGTMLKLMLRPRAGSGDFYYVASVPPAGKQDLSEEFSDFRRHGILKQLNDSCDRPNVFQKEHNDIDVQEKTLTSIIPVRAQAGCWALVISHTTAEFLHTPIGRPYWQQPVVRLAALIYLAVAFLSSLIALSVWRSIRAFGGLARDIRRGHSRDGTFASRNLVPEFSSAAEDFDGLVQELHDAAAAIRKTAEDNAHSFKAPVATIGAALSALGRTLDRTDERQQRMLTLIGASLGRLSALISASQRIDQKIADLIEAPRPRIDMTKVVADVLLRYGELCMSRNIKLARYLEENAIVRASDDVLAETVENVLDNAVSFSPAGSLIEVRVTKTHDFIELTVQDEGPGIDPQKISRIFDRYFSLRNWDTENSDDSSLAAEHAGLGLWIVRRNVEALGGVVSAVNRPGGGLMIRMELPAEA